MKSTKETAEEKVKRLSDEADALANEIALLEERLAKKSEQIISLKRVVVSNKQQ